MVLWLFLNSHSTKCLFSNKYLWEDNMYMYSKIVCLFSSLFSSWFYKTNEFHILISAALKVLDMQSLVFHCLSFCLSVFLRQSLIFSGQVLSSSLMMIVFSLLFYQVAGSCMPYPKIQVCRSIRFSPVRCVINVKQVL